MVGENEGGQICDLDYLDTAGCCKEGSTRKSLPEQHAPAGDGRRGGRERERGENQSSGGSPERGCDGVKKILKKHRGGNSVGREEKASGHTSVREPFSWPSGLDRQSWAELGDQSWIAAGAGLRKRARGMGFLESGMGILQACSVWCSVVQRGLLSTSETVPGSRPALSSNLQLRCSPGSPLPSAVVFE